jgi:DNA helicase-2/ATP-dependent DNA helicase PcrA
VPTYPLTVNRRSDARILDVANHLAEDLYAASRACRRSSQAGAATARCAPWCTDVRRGAGWLADRSRASAAARTTAWREIGVLTRDNPTPPTSSTRLHRRDPGRDRRPQGPAPAARGAEVVATLDLLQDLTANAALLTC